MDLAKMFREETRYAFWIKNIIYYKFNLCDDEHQAS